jgi:hypothetical protein
MSSDLETFRDHCIRMAGARHKPECRHQRWQGFSPPSCDGCNSREDQALFRRLADEVDAYLDKQQESNTPNADADQLELL